MKYREREEGGGGVIGHRRALFSRFEPVTPPRFRPRVYSPLPRANANFFRFFCSTFVPLRDLAPRISAFFGK